MADRHLTRGKRIEHQARSAATKTCTLDNRMTGGFGGGMLHFWSIKSTFSIYYTPIQTKALLVTTLLHVQRTNTLNEKGILCTAGNVGVTCYYVLLWSRKANIRSMWAHGLQRRNAILSKSAVRHIRWHLRRKRDVWLEDEYKMFLLFWYSY